MIGGGERGDTGRVIIAGEGAAPGEELLDYL